jgi:hypothetical protein
MVCAAAAFAQPARKPAPSKKVAAQRVKTKAKPEAPRAAQVTVPKDAERIAPNTYRWADAKGKNWVFRETPFGVVKMEESQYQSPNQAASQPVELRVKEEGDMVHFERPSPFGEPVKWTKKKADLTADEQAAYHKAQGVAAK